MIKTIIIRSAIAVIFIILTFAFVIGLFYLFFFLMDYNPVLTGIAFLIMFFLLTYRHIAKEIYEEHNKFDYE